MSFLLLITSAEFVPCFKDGNCKENTGWELFVIQYFAEAAAWEKKKEETLRGKKAYIISESSEGFWGCFAIFLSKNPIRGFQQPRDYQILSIRFHKHDSLLWHIKNHSVHLCLALKRNPLAFFRDTKNLLAFFPPVNVDYECVTSVTYLVKKF